MAEITKITKTIKTRTIHGDTTALDSSVKIATHQSSVTRELRRIYPIYFEAKSSSIITRSLPTFFEATQERRESGEEEERSLLGWVKEKEEEEEEEKEEEAEEKEEEEDVEGYGEGRIK